MPALEAVGTELDLYALAGCYFFRRALSTAKAPDKSVIAAIADPELISGAGVSPEAIMGEIHTNTIINRLKSLTKISPV